jgi:hypothetical protein
MRWAHDRYALRASKLPQEDVLRRRKGRIRFFLTLETLFGLAAHSTQV